MRSSFIQRLTMHLAYRGFYKNMSDERYLSFMYSVLFRKKINLTSPTTYTEKLQWLKLHDRNPLYTKMVDKYEAKEYVKNIIGESYLIKTLGIYDSFDEIDFSTLPNKFVMKCTHDSGGIIICKDKSSFDIRKAKKQINRFLSNRFCFFGREWPYSNVKPRIIIEEYLEDKNTGNLPDYKFFAFDGVVKAMFVASDRYLDNKEVKFDFYDSEFNHLPIINGHPNATVPPKRPFNFDLMVRLAEQLSLGIPHVRVDFYEVDKKVYFGELTFYHFSGFVPFEPEEWDSVFGKWIDLTKVKHTSED